MAYETLKLTISYDCMNKSHITITNYLLSLQIFFLKYYFFFEFLDVILARVICGLFCKNLETKSFWNYGNNSSKTLIICNGKSENFHISSICVSYVLWSMYIIWYFDQFISIISLLHLCFTDLEKYLESHQ